jgi:hypothetical protein
MKERSRPPRTMIAALAVALLLVTGASAARAEGLLVLCGDPILCEP